MILFSFIQYFSFISLILKNNIDYVLFYVVTFILNYVLSLLMLHKKF
jgi:hypothetical protein